MDGVEKTPSKEIGNKNTAINAIEGMVSDFLGQLSRSSTSLDDGESGDEDNASKSSITLRLADRTSARDNALKNVVFPRKKGSTKTFAQLFRVLEFSHEACVHQIPATKRDIYYKDVPLFQQQRVVDNLVDDLAATFDIDRAELNIRATSKGLVCGPGVKLTLKNGNILSPTDADPILIPVQEDIVSLCGHEPLRWVLIVEKDAIFQHLCHLKITTSPLLPGPGLLITGKGYPDLATRHLVKMLSDSLPDSVPILALVDGDAFGIDILSVYQNGSRALRHQAEALAAKRIKWLGLYASELAQMNIDQEALIPMSEHDEKKAKTMLRDRPDMPPMWRRELLNMLESRRKAEIEILCSVAQDDEGSSTLSSHHSPLLDYLARKITAAVRTASTNHAVI